MADNINNLNGPWDAPLLEGFVKSFPMIVTVYDLETEKAVITKKIDYGNREHRIALGKLTYWAVTNRHSIETMAEADYEKHK